MTRFLLLLSLLATIGGKDLAAGTPYDLGRIQGLFARPGAATEECVLAKFQQYAITTRHNERAGSFAFFQGPFGQPKLSVHDARNRRTGEIERLGPDYQIRGANGQVLGMFDTMLAFPSEISIKDVAGVEIGQLRELVPGSPILKIRGDERCVALFAALGVELTPATDKRDAARLARFEQLHASLVR